MRVINFLFGNTSNKENMKDLSSFAFMGSPMPSFISSLDGVILNINKAFTHLTGYDKNESINKPISILKSGQHNNLFYKELWEQLLKFDTHNYEIYNRCKNGTILLMQISVTKIKHSDTNYFIVTLADITQQRKLENRQQHLATHDPLTGLANRTLLKDRFSQAILHANRNNKKVALFLCDLNDFKNVNDNYGHNFGDKVLITVANKLTSLVRDSDTVARYGGDEFIIITDNLQNEAEALDILHELKTKTTILVEDAGNSSEISMAVGHAIFPSNGTQFDQLVSIADIKMYDSKKESYGY